MPPKRAHPYSDSSPSPKNLAEKAVKTGNEYYMNHFDRRTVFVEENCQIQELGPGRELELLTTLTGPIVVELICCDAPSTSIVIGENHMFFGKFVSNAGQLGFKAFKSSPL